MPNGDPGSVGIGEVELVPAYAHALLQSVLKKTKKREEGRQLAETLEQRASTQMHFDQYEVGTVELGDKLLDAAQRSAVAVAETLAEE